MKRWTVKDWDLGAAGAACYHVGRAYGGRSGCGSQQLSATPCSISQPTVTSKYYNFNITGITGLFLTSKAESIPEKRGSLHIFTIFHGVWSGVYCKPFMIALYCTSCSHFLVVFATWRAIGKTFEDFLGSSGHSHRSKCFRCISCTTSGRRHRAPRVKQTLTYRNYFIFIILHWHQLTSP